MTNTFTGEEFAKRLSEGKLELPIVKTGMVKKHESDPKALWFVEGAACGEWIRVPVDLIEQVIFIGNARCRDHEHPLVRIEFKDPPANNEAAQVFAQLARRNAPPTGMPGSATVPGMAGLPGSGMPGPAGTPGMPMPGPPGAGPRVVDRKAGGGLGTGGMGGNVECIAWHYECRWVDVWISSLNASIPIYWCFLVCDTIMF